MNAPKKIWAIPAIGGGWGDDMGMWRKSSTKIEGQAEYTRSDLCALAAPQPDAQTQTRVTVWLPVADAPQDRTVVITIRADGSVAKGTWYKNPFGDENTFIDRASGRWWTAIGWIPMPAAIGEPSL